MADLGSTAGSPVCYTHVVHKRSIQLLRPEIAREGCRRREVASSPLQDATANFLPLAACEGRRQRAPAILARLDLHGTLEGLET